MFAGILYKLFKKMLLFQILFLVSFMATQSKATVIQCKPLCTKDLQLMNYTVNSLESKARRFDLLTGKMDIFCKYYFFYFYLH